MLCAHAHGHRWLVARVGAISKSASGTRRGSVRLGKTWGKVIPSEMATRSVHLSPGKDPGKMERWLDLWFRCNGDFGIVWYTKIQIAHRKSMSFLDIEDAMCKGNTRLPKF